MEDDKWEDTIQESETGLVLLNKLEEFIIGIGDEESCIGNVVECKVGLLLPNKADGEVGLVAAESGWEATVRDSIMGLL